MHAETGDCHLLTRNTWAVAPGRKEAMTGGAERPCLEPDVATHIQAMLERVRLTLAEASALQADNSMLTVVNMHTGEPFERVSFWLQRGCLL